MAIKTWACELTREMFERERNRIVPREKLTGRRAGPWSIRNNDQYRVCFVFRSGDAFQVEIVDYH